MAPDLPALYIDRDAIIYSLDSRPFYITKVLYSKYVKRYKLQQKNENPQ